MYTQEEYIKECKLIHNNFYEYGNTVYTRAKAKIVVTCPIHGDFTIIAANHRQNKAGCKKCSIQNKQQCKLKTTEKFILEASRLHANKYSYSNAEYKGAKVKLTITCPEHGDFKQSPNNHLSGYGCKECGRTTAVKKRSKDTNAFILESNKVHNNVYDYSKTVYTKNYNKVIVICPEHGEFTVVANNHVIGGTGCPECSRKHSGKTKIENNKKRFISKALAIHNGIYDYRKVNYQGCRQKVEIICPKHGVFEQVPYCHLSGNGCPTCNSSKGESKIEQILIGNNIEYIREWSNLVNPNTGFRVRYDFYLPKINTVIEYDGIQHFKPVNFFGGAAAYERTIKQDSLKNKLCALSGIQIVRISYKNLNKIERIINEKIIRCYP